MKLELLLLGVLIEGKQSGYGLKKYLDSHGRFLRSNTTMSHVYMSLARMEKNGWIRHRTEPRSGAQDAKIFEPTDEGITVFLDWLESPYQPPSRFNDPDFMARLSFGGLMTDEQLLGLIDTELETRRAQISRDLARDRTRARDLRPEYEARRADIIEEWRHWTGSEDLVRHIESLQQLREQLVAEMAVNSFEGTRAGRHPR